jgi:hypothetical protein
VWPCPDVAALQACNRNRRRMAAPVGGGDMFMGTDAAPDPSLRTTFARPSRVALGRPSAREAMPRKRAFSRARAGRRKTAISLREANASLEPNASRRHRRVAVLPKRASRPSHAGRRNTICSRFTPSPCASRGEKVAEGRMRGAFATEATHAFRRYASGVVPTRNRNCRLKCDCVAKPQRCAMSATGRSC